MRGKRCLGCVVLVVPWRSLCGTPRQDRVKESMFHVAGIGSIATSLDHVLASQAYLMIPLAVDIDCGVVAACLGHTGTWHVELTILTPEGASGSRMRLCSSEKVHPLRVGAERRDQVIMYGAAGNSGVYQRVLHGCKDACRVRTKRAVKCTDMSSVCLFGLVRIGFLDLNNNFVVIHTCRGW
ncbi:hypothetical protein MRX96_011051 [Rhipicephalus microplus]